MTNTPQIKPSAPNAEKSILAMMTIDPLSVAPYALAAGVDRSWFYIPAHKTLWDIMVERYNNGQPVDDITSIMQHLADIGQLESVGGASGLSEVFSYATNTALLNVHLAELRDKYARRCMIDELAKAYDTSTPYTPSDTAELALQLSTKTESKSESMSDIMNQVLSEIDTMSRTGTHISGLRTGFPALDDMLGGLRGGTLNILGARPAMGKTAIGMNIALNVADELKKNKKDGRVLFLTAEMTSAQLAYRMIQTVARVNVQEYAQGKHPGYNNLEDARKRIHHAAKLINTLPLHIVDVTGWNIGRISQFIAAEHRKNPFVLVVMDYIQLIKGNTKKAQENTVEQIAEASQGLKAVAKRHNIPVLALAQVNRESAKAGASGKAPTLADLKGCGSLEQDADSVTFIHRPAYYNNNKSEQVEDEKHTEIILAKNRYGKTGVISARFFGEYSLFVQP